MHRSAVITIAVAHGAGSITRARMFSARPDDPWVRADSHIPPAYKGDIADLTRASCIGESKLVGLSPLVAAGKGDIVAAMVDLPAEPPLRSSSPVKSATRALDIVEYVIARDAPVVAQEIAAGLAIPVSSLSYLLTTLVDRDYLARDGRRYSAGPGIARLQPRAAGFSLKERVAPLVRALRVQLNETASFFVQAGWQVEALVTETGDHALRYAVRIGARTPLHGFAAGKAVLASMTDDEISRYLAESTRIAFTPATITAADDLRREIDTIRRDGVARTREEHTPGIQGIARVASAGGVVLGAFGVAVPTVRFDAAVESRAAALLAKTCALLVG